MLSTRPRPLRIAAALFVVVAATTARAHAASPLDATAILEAADESLRTGDFKEAIRQYN